MNLDNLLRLPTSPQEFLRQTSTATLHALISEYVRYMLETAGAYRLPTDLDRVIQAHGFRQPKGPLVAPMGRRGLQVGSILVVNPEDAAEVQRFSQGHELTEALFAALEAEKPRRFTSADWRLVTRNKERLCDSGAAEFLLPADLFFPLVARHGMKLENAKVWASRYHVSLTAAVRRMLDANVLSGIFLLAQEPFLRHRQSLRSAHGVLLNDASGAPWKPAAAGLQVIQVWQSPQTKQIVKLNETIPCETSIYRTYRAGFTNVIERCNDNHTFELLTGRYLTESLLVTMQDKPTVMALIHVRD
jgi:Zn-dependent peptidase ImmA (M78 family)